MRSNLVFIAVLFTLFILFLFQPSLVFASLSTDEPCEFQTRRRAVGEGESSGVGELESSIVGDDRASGNAC